MIEIRKTEIAELGILVELFEQGKRIMRKSGNMKQWTGGYPDEELVKKDLSLIHISERQYVHLLRDKRRIAAFHVSVALPGGKDLRLHFECYSCLLYTSRCV